MHMRHNQAHYKCNMKTKLKYNTYEECTEVYCQERFLKNHIKVFHRKGVEYKCKIETCGKVFLRAQHRNKHYEQVHVNQNRRVHHFSCPKCNLSTQNYQEFLEHMRTGHPIKSELFKKYMS